MKLRNLNKEEFEDWNAFVDKSPQGSIFSKTWYLEALQVEFKILSVFDKNNALFAGVVLAKNQINTYSNPMFDKYLGVLLRGEKNVSHKIISNQYKAMELLAVELKKYKSFDYYSHPEFKNWIPFYWQGFTQQTRYTYRIDLDSEMSQIQSRFHGNIKNDIKNAVNNSISIKTNIEFTSFYDIINKTFLRQGSKAPFGSAKLKSFIDEMVLRDRYVSFGAFDKNNKLIAVCGLVYDDNSSYLLLNGIDIENQLRGANALMIFESIKFFKEKGIPFYDFEGSMLPGVEQFYRRFGGELVPYMRIWSDNFFNYTKSKAKVLYKKLRYGR